MAGWEGVHEMRVIKEFFNARFTQTWQIICESQNEPQAVTQMHCFMIGLTEKILSLCPTIRDLLFEENQQNKKGNEGKEGTGGRGIGGDPKTLVEVLARLTQLQQFVQGGHGSQSRNF